MKIPYPFIPLRAETENLQHTVHVIERDYTIGKDGILTSIRSQGIELLASPMRIVLTEDGEEANWDMDYPANESESFIQHRSDEEIVICGAKQSDRFIVDVCYRIDYDGCIDMDFKLMTRGKTVAQVFGIAESKPTLFKLDRLWLEIPLRAEAMTLFHMHPNSTMTLADGTERPVNSMSMSGTIPTESAAMPFKSLLWLGNEERGLGWFAENDRNWQPADRNRAMELIRDGDALILRIRMLDSHPKAWKADPANGIYGYQPIEFRFGLHPTPVKPFPKQPYIHNAFHLDCGIKVKGNYIDVLAGRYDELKEKGVTTLILHEKWNNSQNWFELSEFTAHQIRTITDECHKRGIKVLTYFGYEISTMSPEWSELHEQTANKTSQNRLDGGWWRVPFQRAYNVCYNSDYADLFIEGVTKMMDEYHTDGVYLDGTSHARLCYSTEHGCGWYDEDGNLHGSYRWSAVRRLFKRLYEVVESRGGEINVHAFGFINFTAIPYIHQNWYGENLQFALMKGSSADMNLDYFRAEYIIESEEGTIWTIQDQGELTDMLTCHPYPSPTVGGDVTPANRLRCTMIPTAQLAYYSGISGRPAMIEEQGTFSDMLINREGAADFARVNMLSGWANGSRGYLWWCGMEHLKLSQPPYSWSMIERELGLLDIDRNPKPVGDTMKETVSLLTEMPELSDKVTDAVCVLSREMKHWPVAASSYILAKQAGIELQFRTSRQIRKPSDLPDAPLYLIPNLTGWAPLHKEAYDALLEKAYNGAVLYISVATGFITECEKVTGMRSNGMYNAGSDSMIFADGTSLPMQYRKKFLLESIGAEVIACDSYGNPVFTKNPFGRGWVYMLYFPLEQMLWNNALAFTGREKADYSKIYRMIGEKVLSAHPVDKANNQVGMTLHPTENGYTVVLINYDNTIHDAELTVRDGWRMEPVYGDVSRIEKCSMAVISIIRDDG